MGVKWFEAKILDFALYKSIKVAYFQWNLEWGHQQASEQGGILGESHKAVIAALMATQPGIKIISSANQF